MAAKDKREHEVMLLVHSFLEGTNKKQGVNDDPPFIIYDAGGNQIVVGQCEGTGRYYNINIEER